MLGNHFGPGLLKKSQGGIGRIDIFTVKGLGGHVIVVAPAITCIRSFSTGYTSTGIK